MTLRFLRVLHRWLGLVLALPMLLQGISGCFLALTPIWEDIRPTPAVASGTARPASAILAAAAMPNLVPVRYTPATDGNPAIVEMGVPGQRGAQAQLLIDPVTTTILATRHPSATYRWVHTLHEHLLVPPLGRSFVGWFGVGLTILGLTGVVLWWPSPGRWRAAVTVSGKARGARLQRELHGAAGFWMCGMLVVMSISGVTLSFPQTMRSLFTTSEGAGAPPRAARPPAGREGAGREGGNRGDNQELLDIDAVITRAATAIPGRPVTDMRLPSQPGRPVMVFLQRSSTLGFAMAPMVSVDPAGRRVLSVQNPATQPLGLRVLGALRALHFGEAIGLPWRLLVALMGVVLPGLAVTGATLWFLKRRNRLQISAQRRAALQGAGQS